MVVKLHVLGRATRVAKLHVKMLVKVLAKTDVRVPVFRDVKILQKEETDKDKVEMAHRTIEL